MSKKCEFCGKVVFMSTFGLTCLECNELPARQNRIRKLEAAIMRIRDFKFGWRGTNAHEDVEKLQKIAREALE